MKHVMILFRIPQAGVVSETVLTVPAHDFRRLDDYLGINNDGTFASFLLYQPMIFFFFMP